MKSIGLQLRRPRFWAFTSASLLAIGLWLFVSGIATRMQSDLSTADFAALLAVIWWMLTGAQFGLDARANWRHALVQVAGCGLLAVAMQSIF